MFTELLQAEVWKKRLETAQYRVILEPFDSRDRYDRLGNRIQERDTLPPTEEKAPAST
jgi:hypothetical protein